MTEPKPRYTIIPNPPAITPLESAMAKLTEDDSKSIHLSPREAAAVVERYQYLRFLLREVLSWEPTCNCHEAYKSRGLTAPDCGLHAYWFDEKLTTAIKNALGG